ncbi:hypothetical protein NDU88_002318 [Pleurodeles waltl]|uniref:Uncharacterized protein n=1 Tax=Pleurodeles waltl TaxID=8319 RepID=A0AAV7NHB9_PLEWA|nr:hypothetical protein NDU88_002318 [Pleurodeles waltl]
MRCGSPPAAPQPPCFKGGVRPSRNRPGPPRTRPQSWPRPQRRRRPISGGQGTGAPGRARLVRKGAAPAGDPRGQLQVAEPAPPSIPLPVWSRGPAAEACPGRRTAPTGLLARQGRPQRPPRGGVGVPQPRSEGFREGTRQSSRAVHGGRAAGSDGRRFQTRRHSCAPGGSPGEQTPGTGIYKVEDQNNHIYFFVIVDEDSDDRIFVAAETITDGSDFSSCSVNAISPIQCPSVNDHSIGATSTITPSTAIKETLYISSKGITSLMSQDISKASPSPPVRLLEMQESWGKSLFGPAYSPSQLNVKCQETEDKDADQGQPTYLDVNFSFSDRGHQSAQE